MSDINFIKIKTEKEFYSLKRGNLVIVDWGFNDLELYKIHGFIKDKKELIFCKKRNHYCISSMYLDGSSGAKAIYLAHKE